MMTARRGISADQLLAGPRGRRMLLDFAQEFGREADVADRHPLDSAAFDASYRLAKLAGRSITRFGWPPVDPEEIPSATPADVAAALATSPLPTPTPELLRSCLASSVDAAMYWQGPDGDDLLCADPAVREALRRVADRLCAAPASAWLAGGFEPGRQVILNWQEAQDPPPCPAVAVLGTWRDAVSEEEAVARRERPTDPAANWSGEWWSTPPHGLPVTCGELFDGTPSGLWFVEDALGWDRATARRVAVPSGARVFEIDGAEDWASLCRAHPLEVTALRRHDWYRATGGFREPGWAGRWLVPDWAAVAEHYDAVHLSYAGYLSAAGRAIPVEGALPGDPACSLIAGWNPDATYWLTDLTDRGGEAVPWRRVEDADGDHSWV